jgi:hypothetical protein
MQNSGLKGIHSKDMVVLLLKSLTQASFMPYILLSQGNIKTNLSEYTMLLVKVFALLYGAISVLRLYGIGFMAEILTKKLVMKIGFSVPINILIPKMVHVRLKNDERKKPNII